MVELSLVEPRHAFEAIQMRKAIRPGSHTAHALAEAEDGLQASLGAPGDA